MRYAFKQDRKKSAELLASRSDLAGIQTIFTSDLQRTVQTAAPLAVRLGLTPIQRSDLREVNWENYYRDPLLLPKPAPYGFESHENIHLRGKAFLQSLIENPVPSPLLVITHAGFLRNLLTQVLRVPAEAYRTIRTALNVIELREAKWEAVSLNDDSHLIAAPDALSGKDYG